jgi:hypothetical protein
MSRAMNRSIPSLSLASLPLAFFCISCSVHRIYIPLEPGGKTAVIGFSLGKSFTEEGSERDSGPGLLQNKEKYYQPHHDAVESMWAQAKDSLPGAFGIESFVPFDSVISHPKYVEATTHPSRKILGRTITAGDGNVYPKGFGYVSIRDQDRLDPLFDALGAEYLIVFENTAGAKKSGNFAVSGAITIPNANLALQTTVYLFRKGKGLAWSKTFFTKSSSEGMMIDHELNPDKAPKLAMEAQSDLWGQIRAEKTPPPPAEPK